MITENLSTLKIHKLSQAQYDRELANGTLDPNAIYLTPDDGYTSADIDAKFDAQKVFTATYGVTTYQEIVDAYNAGRVVQCKDDMDIIYHLMAVYSESCIFAGQLGADYVGLYISVDNQWERPSISFALADELAAKADAEHNHEIADITNLQPTLDELSDAISKSASANHNHNDTYYTKTEIGNMLTDANTVLANKADKNHNHNDIYYTRAEIDDMELITVANIDAICGVVTLISFTISGTQWQAEEGMTWAEWCDSDYSYSGYNYNSNGVVFLDSVQYPVENVKSSDVIIANKNYIVYTGDEV